MVGGDVLELRIYNTTLSGGSLRLAWKSVYGPIPLVQPICAAPVHPSDRGIQVALRQTAGSPRSYPWKLLRQPSGAVLMTPPPQAVAAGFTNLVFSDDFKTTTTIATSGAAAAGFNWYWDSSGVTSTADYSVNTAAVPGVGDGLSTAPGASSGILTILTAHNTFSSQLTTTFRSQIGSNHTGAWNHGYFEAYIYFNPTVQGGGGPSAGWPAFWSLDTRMLSSFTGQVCAECDFMEAFPSGTAGSGSNQISTLHNWTATSGAATGTDSFNSNFPNNFPNAGNPTAGWHKYGCLWQGDGTHGTVSLYHDDVILVFPTSAFNPTGSVINLDGTAAATAGFSAMESAFMRIILGTGPTWPMLVDYVNVFQ